MKRLITLFLLGVLLFPAGIHAAIDTPEHLQFSFRLHCEEDDADCESDIFEENEDAFMLEEFTLGEPMSIDLVVDNPRLEMISSVRAKLKYDPQKLDVIRLDTRDSDFRLAAPDGDEFDQDEGVISIGRSFTGGSKSFPEFLVATIRLTPLEKGAMLEFMNFQTTELGDTGIFFVNSSALSENRLRDEPKPLVFGDNPQIGNIGGPITDDGAFVPRPEGLQIQTDEQGNVRLLWPIGEDPPIKGYYLYYGQQGNYYYLRRRDVGRTNFALFPDLPRGKKYYFSITAYDADENESEYSEEVSVIVGQPGTESHPFEGSLELPGDDNEEEAPEPEPVGPDTTNMTPESGPEHIVFFLVISFGVAFIWYSLRKRT